MKLKDDVHYSLLILLILRLTSPALAETDATYDLSWWTVDGGGATGLTSGATRSRARPASRMRAHYHPVIMTWRVASGVR